MATRYVRPDGNNANAGNGPASNQAWATPVYAATQLAASDICYVAPGFYVGGLAFTNSGIDMNAGTGIKLKGDPMSTQFPGVSVGEVIIAQRNSLHGNTLYAGATVPFGTKHDIVIENITLEAGSGPVLTGGVISGGTYNMLINCKVFGNISGFPTLGTIPPLYCYFCEFYRTQISTTYSLSFYSCYFANLQMALGSSATWIEFIQCVVHLSTVLLSSSTATSSNAVMFHGCHIYAGSGGASAAGYVITIPLNGATQVLLYNCTVEGACNFIDFFTNNNAGRLEIGQCKIKHMQKFYKKGTSTGAQSLSYISFEGMVQCVQATNATYPITIEGAVIDKCVTWGSSYVTFTNAVVCYGGNTGGATMTSPSYRLPTEDEVYPVHVSTANVITGQTKSLQFHGAPLYRQVYEFLLPCTASVASTVSFKYKFIGGTGGDVHVQVATANYVNVAAANTELTASVTYTHYATELVRGYIFIYSDDFQSTFIIGDIAFS